MDEHEIKNSSDQEIRLEITFLRLIDVTSHLILNESLQYILHTY